MDTGDIGVVGTVRRPPLLDEGLLLSSWIPLDCWHPMMCDVIFYAPAMLLKMKYGTFTGRQRYDVSEMKGTQEEVKERDGLIEETQSGTL